MADTTFVDGTTLTAADWFNDVNRVVYTILADPADAAAVRTAIDAQQDVFTTIGDSVVATTAGAAARLAAKADVAAHATTANIWGAREIVLTGGVVTFTDIADAPYVGAVSWVKQNAAHIWTDGAVFEVQGNANYTAVAGDWIRVYATTVSTFEVTLFKADAYAGAAASDTVAGVIEIAVQSEVEAASSALLAVPPSRIHFNPGVSKVWGYVTISGGVPTLAASYNVTSITDDGVGLTTITIATDFSTANYSVNVSVQATGAYGSKVSAIAAGSFQHTSFDTTTGTATDAVAGFFFSCLGDQ